MENKKKAIISTVIVVLILVALVIGASYAYFSVTSTNSFGSKTISASAPEVGSVTLASDNNALTLNLSAGDMMRKSGDVTYYGTTDGTPTTSENVVEIAHTTVNGPGFFNCNYTLNVTATGTNNLYTAFQGWSGKSTGQIVLNINGIDYDFNAQNLFPITIPGAMNGVSSSTPKQITASIRMLNYYSLNQSALANKDITITITATSFTCSIAETPQTYYYTFNSNTDWPWLSEPLTSNDGLNHYIKGYGTTGVYSEVCRVSNSTEYCLQPNTWSNASTYYSEMTALGATCNSTYLTDNLLRCDDDSFSYYVSSYGDAAIDSFLSPVSCSITGSGDAVCSWH